MKTKTAGLNLIILLCLLFDLQAQNLNSTQPYADGFKENKGQVLNQFRQPNAEVLFMFSGPGSQVQLRKTGFSYELFRLNNPPLAMGASKKARPVEELLKSKQNSCRIDIDFMDMNPFASIISEGMQSGFDNYYLAGKEIENVRSYSKITYKNVYPNTDIEFIVQPESPEKFKYNIILHPGARLEAVKLSINGAIHLQKNQAGNLLMETGLGTISEQIPYSYYTDNQNTEALVAFNLQDNILSFNTTYDNSKTLVIDPISNLVWGTYYGSANLDYCTATAVDGQNNVYMSGYTNSTSNIATSGSYQNTFSAIYDAYVVKFNPSGQRQWASYLGDAGVDVFYAIYVEANGTVYLAGDTSSPNGIVSIGAQQTVYGGGIDDALLTKFNASGIRQWCTYMGGPKHDIAQAVTVDSQGNIIITGHTESISGISTPGAYCTNYTLNYDVFIAKYSPGGARIWGTYYGDSDVDEAYGIATDKANNIIITGATASIAGIVTSACHQNTFGGYQDAFISKFNPAGNTLIWATYYGGTGNDYGTDVEVDTLGTIYVSGNTTSPNGIATPGCYQATQGSSDDTYLGSFSSAGVRLWCTYFGGEDVDYIDDLQLDSKKNLLICGSTASSFSISTPGAYQQSLNVTYFYDAYFAKFSKTGSIVLATYFGGPANDYAKGIAIDGLGKIYLAGETSSTIGIATSGSHMPALGGSTDSYLAKFCIPFIPVLSPAGTKTVCTGATTLSAAAGYSTYLWNNTFTTNPLVINSTSLAGTYTFVLSVNDGYGCSGLSDTTFVIAKLCVGINENEIQNGLLVFPNPVKDQLHFAWNEAAPNGFDVELTTSSGQLILKAKGHNGEGTLNLEKLPAGLYLLRLRNGDTEAVKKIVKE